MNQHAILKQNVYGTKPLSVRLILAITFQLVILATHLQLVSLIKIQNVNMINVLLQH